MRGYVELESVRVKSVPLFGRVVDIRWKGNFEGDLMKLVNEDVSIKERLIGLNEGVTIRSVPGWGWAMSSRGRDTTWFGRMPKGLAPTQEKWDCYTIIARHLVECSVEGEESEDELLRLEEMRKPGGIEPLRDDR